MHCLLYVIAQTIKKPLFSYVLFISYLARVWLRIVINESSLERHLNAFLANVTLLRYVIHSSITHRSYLTVSCMHRMFKLHALGQCFFVFLFS